MEAGIEPRFEDFTGTDPIAFCQSMNDLRRQLDESQRALVAARLARLPKGANQHRPIGLPTQKEASEQFGVSERSIKRAAALIRADENGKPAAEPELIKAVGIWLRRCLSSN